jgi:hypothetical protein
LAIRSRRRIVLRVELRAVLATCRHASNLRRTLTIAFLVGCIPSIINRGNVIAHGDATGATALKVCLNFVVPFVVSNFGAITGDRTARR